MWNNFCNVYQYFGIAVVAIVKEYVEQYWSKEHWNKELITHDKDIRRNMCFVFNYYLLFVLSLDYGWTMLFIAIYLFIVHRFSWQIFPVFDGVRLLTCY